MDWHHGLPSTLDRCQGCNEEDEILQHQAKATSSNGNPFIIMPESKNYLNPHLVYSRSEWPLRSTAIQLEDYTWEMVEFCYQYYISDYVDSEIEECDKPTFVLTMLHKQEEPFTVFGQVGAQEMIEARGSNGDPNSFTFPEEPKVPMEMAEHFKPEEVDQVEPRGAGGESAPTFEWQFENKDTLVVNDEPPLTIDSSIGFLRAAAEYLGVSKNGNKEMIWTRLNQKVQTLEHEQPFLDSNRLHRDEQWKQSLVGQSVPRTPSEEEVAFCTSCRICPIEIGALTVRVAKANKIHNVLLSFPLMIDAQYLALRLTTAFSRLRRVILFQQYWWQLTAKARCCWLCLLLQKGPTFEVKLTAWCVFQWFSSTWTRWSVSVTLSQQ